MILFRWAPVNPDSVWRDRSSMLLYDVICPDNLLGDNWYSIGEARPEFRFAQIPHHPMCFAFIAHILIISLIQANQFDNTTVRTDPEFYENTTLVLGCQGRQGANAVDVRQRHRLIRMRCGSLLSWMMLRYR